MGKRKARSAFLPDGNDILGIQGVADDKAVRLYNLGLAAAGVPQEQQVQRKDWKPSLEKAASTKSFKPVQLPSVNHGQTVTWFVATVSELLQEVLDSCENYRSLLWTASLQHNHRKPLQLLGYHDECTAGNILGADTARKASLFYISVREVGFLHSDTVWHPIAMIQHGAVSAVQGGFSKVFLSIVESLLREDLHMGVPLRFGSTTRVCFFNVQHWVGDLDALRLSYDCKGAAGLRVCIRCKNVLKRDSGVPRLDNYFLEVGTNDVSLFDLQTDPEIFQVVDDLLSKKTTLPKGKVQQLEVISGFLANEHGLLAAKSARQFAPPSSWLLDPMHLYYSNGACSWEVINVMDRVANLGITLKLLQDTVSQTLWVRAQDKPHTPSWRKQLFHESRFTGESYRGSALDTQALLPLLYFTLEQALANQTILEVEMKSLKCLLQIHLELSRLKRQKCNLDTDVLNTLQQEHQQLYSEAYGDDRMKPKHHMRMHLPEQMKKSDLYIDCLPMEKKHKTYKSHTASGRYDSFCRGSRNEEGQYNLLCLQRCFYQHVDNVRSMQFGSEIISPGKAILTGQRLAVGDVVLRPVAGRISCFAWGTAGCLEVTIEKFRLQTKEVGRSTWKQTREYEVLREVLQTPSWWSWDGDICLCLH